MSDNFYNKYSWNSQLLQKTRVHAFGRTWIFAQGIQFIPYPLLSPHSYSFFQWCLFFFQRLLHLFLLLVEKKQIGRKPISFCNEALLIIFLFFLIEWFYNRILLFHRYHVQQSLSIRQYDMVSSKHKG